MDDANVLDAVDMRELGEELKRARKKRGLTQNDAAEIIGVARTTVTAIEKGDRRIKADELIRLARAYGRRVSDFVRQRPTVQPFAVQFRGPYLGTAEDEEQISVYVNEFEELCRDYVELEEIVGAPLPRKYPQEEDISGCDIESAAETLADRERKRLGLGDGPIPVLRDILEREVGLRVFYMEMYPSKYSEMYIYDERLGGCIAVNSLHPEERRRWSLSHGYAHFLVHRYRPTMYVEGRYQRLPESERFADAFARYFLMPTISVRKQYDYIVQARRGFTVADLLTLAHYFGVSVAAFTLRLEGMELLHTGTWDQLRDSRFGIQEAQQRLGLEPIERNDRALPIRYQYLAIQAYTQGLISEGQFARFLRVERVEARRIATELRGHAAGVTDDTGIEIDLGQPLNQ
jgi:Zn-dependent peptidase ImmA (M78 family)/transcriptional regulator with XRE-family HTH domain